MPDSTTRRGRERRRFTHSSPLAHIPWRTITNPMPPRPRLTPEAEEKIHDASLRILEEVGILFMDGEALALWEQAGAKVDRGREQLWLDRALVMELVARAPSHFT